MTNLEKTKKHKTLYQVLGIIGDIIFIPIILIALVSSSAMFVARSQNAMPSIFGVSLGFVASESMEPSGFMKGDVVFLVKCDPYTLKVGTPDDIEDELGDVIAFYQYSDPADSRLGLTRVDDSEVLTAPDPSEIDPELANSRVSVSNLPDNVRIVFHEVVGRYVDSDGTLFLQTKGTRNTYEDDVKVRADYVLGKYTYTPNWLRATFRFCASQMGMIILVVLPLGILILFECFSLIEQANNMMIEKAVIQGKLRYNDPDSIKANVGIEMNDVEKVRFYALAAEEDKEGVQDFLWKYLEDGDKSEKEEYEFVKKALDAYKVNPEIYFDMWTEHIKGKKNKEKLNVYREEWRVKNNIANKENHLIKQGETLGKENREDSSSQETTKEAGANKEDKRPRRKERATSESGASEQNATEQEANAEVGSASSNANKQGENGQNSKLPKRPKKPEEPK